MRAPRQVPDLVQERPGVLRLHAERQEFHPGSGERTSVGAQFRPLPGRHIRQTFGPNEA